VVVVTRGMATLVKLLGGGGVGCLMATDVYSAAPGDGCIVHTSYHEQSSLAAENDTYFACMPQRCVRTKMAHSARLETPLARAWKDPRPLVVLQPAKSGVLPHSPSLG
jgi:hypothetical protein